MAHQALTLLEAILDNVKTAVEACNWFSTRTTSPQIQDAREAQEGVKHELTKLLNFNLKV